MILLGLHLLVKVSFRFAFLVSVGSVKHVGSQLEAPQSLFLLDTHSALFLAISLFVILFRHIVPGESFLQLVVALVDLTLRLKQVLDLIVKHNAAVAQVFNARLGHFNVCLNLYVVVFQIASNLLLLALKIVVLIALLLLLSRGLLFLNRIRQLSDVSLELVEADPSRFGDLLTIVVVLIFRDLSVVMLILRLEVLHLPDKYSTLISQDFARVVLVEVLELQVLEDLHLGLLVFLEFHQTFITFAL